jgi:hypothetical protein
MQSTTPHPSKAKTLAGGVGAPWNLYQIYEVPMSDDSEIGKREIENMILDQLLDSLPIITRRAVTEEWEGVAEKVEGSPDHIISLDGKPFAIELTEIRDAEDAEGYVEEAYRLASKKSESYSRRGIFRFPIALAMYSSTPPLFDFRASLEATTFHADFEALGFAEIWAVDFSDAYYSPRDPRRPADVFCFKPAAWFGFHRIGGHNRKPYG